MPNGKVHYEIWSSRSARVTVIGLALLLSAIMVSPIPALGVSIGYTLGQWISPDLDLVSITSDEARMMKHFGIIGAMMVGYWTVYAYVMRFVGIKKKGHRNFFSHFPGISTIIRLAWMIWLPIGLFFYFDTPVPWYVWETLIYIWVGLSFADLLHFAADENIIKWR